MRNRIRSRCSPTSRTIRSTSTNGTSTGSTWSARGTSTAEAIPALTVAVIDSGLAYIDQGAFRQAPDLAGATFVAPHDFIWDDETPTDLDGHGTHVAGTIGERTGNGIGAAGMAFNVALMPLKAVSGPWDEALGAPNVGTASIVAEAVRYAADHGAQRHQHEPRIRRPRSRPCATPSSTPSTRARSWLAAAGNSGDEGSPEFWPAAYASSIDGLIAVGAVDYNFNRASYSNSNAYVEVAAPGGNLDADAERRRIRGWRAAGDARPATWSTDGIFNQFGYFFFEGTSMADAARVGPGSAVDDARREDAKGSRGGDRALATDVGPPGRDNDTGFGVINPRGASYGIGLAK